MSLLVLVVVLAIVGVLLYYIRAAPKIDPTIKTIIFVVVVISVVIFVLSYFGIWDEIRNFKAG